jgi:hypothetical protein
MPPHVACELRAEPVPSAAYPLVANVDAAREQQVFDVPQGQRVLNPPQHRYADHLG